MLYTLRNQNIYTDIKMNKNFKPEKNIILSGVNENGIMETHEINNVDFRSGIAKDKKTNNLYLLDRDAMTTYSDIYMDSKGTKTFIEEIPESFDILAIDMKNRNILYSENEGADKNKLFVVNYSENLDDVIETFKSKHGYSSDYNGTMIYFEDSKSYDYYPFANKDINYNKDKSNYMLNYKSGEFVGDIVYVDYEDENMTSKHHDKTTLVIDDNGKRKVVSSITAQDVNKAVEAMGPYLMLPYEGELKKEQPEEENARKLDIVKKNTQNGVLNSGDLSSTLLKNTTLEDVSVNSKGEIVGNLGEKNVAFAFSSMYKQDGQLYIQNRDETYQIVSLNQEYVKKQGIKSVDDVFEKSTNLKNGLKNMTISDFDIVKESKYNATTKRFEEKYALIYEDGKNEIILDKDKKVFLSLENGFLQVKDKNYFLEDPKNPNLQSNIIHSSVSCYVEDIEFIRLKRENNKVIMYEDELHKADIVDTKNKIAFKDGVVYTVDANTTKAVGEDIAKPSLTEVNYVRSEKNDLQTGKLNDTNLNVKLSNKIDNWSIERYGSKVYLTGITEKGNINHELISLDELELPKIRRGLNEYPNALPRASIKINGQKQTFELGFPSDTMTKKSAYIEPMDRMIEQYGFEKIAQDISMKMEDKLRYVEPQEAVRAIPNECFVVLDDRLFLKINNRLINNEISLDFKNEQFNIQSAFTTIPSDSRQIKSLINQPIYVTKEDGEYKLTTIDKTGKSTELSVVPLSEFADDKYAARETDLVKSEPMMER